MPFWGVERTRRGLILRSSEDIGARNTCTGPTLSCQQIPKNIIQTYPKKFRPFGLEHKKLVQHQKICIRCLMVKRAHKHFPFAEEIGVRKSVYGPTLSCQQIPKNIIQTYPKKFRPFESTWQFRAFSYGIVKFGSNCYSNCIQKILTTKSLTTN